MTPPLADRRCLLLDFDGPICSVFAGLPDRIAAAELTDALAPPTPASVRCYTDPFDVLRYAAEYRPNEAKVIEKRFTTVEINAVALAHPTPGAAALICSASERPASVVAVVSNNSAAAIDTYLTDQGLRGNVAGIFARTSADVGRLKPAPTLLTEALDTLGFSADEAVFVGDSLTDAQAGRAAGIPVIAFANRPEKVDRFNAVHPAAVITDMAQLRGLLAL